MYIRKGGLSDLDLLWDLARPRSLEWDLFLRGLLERLLLREWERRLDLLVERLITHTVTVSHNTVRDRPLNHTQALLSRNVIKNRESKKVFIDKNHQSICKRIGTPTIDLNRIVKYQKVPTPTEPLTCVWSESGIFSVWIWSGTLSASSCSLYLQG